MSEQFNFYALSFIIASLIPGITAIYVWRRRTAIGAKMFALLMLALTIWTLAYGLELATTTLEEMLFWIKIEYLGIATLPWIWIIFTLQYTRHENWLTWRIMSLLFIIPGLTLILNWTNKFHYLHYSQTSVDTTGPIPLLVYSPLHLLLLVAPGGGNFALA
jgi:N-terminal 7TM region of histidine kinase